VQECVDVSVNESACAHRHVRKRVGAFTDASGNALRAFVDTSTNAEIEMLKI